MRYCSPIAALAVLFVLYPASGFAKDPTRVGFGSCNADPAPSAVWTVLRDEQLDGFVFLGDNVYLPEKNLSRRSTYAKTYQRLFSQPAFTQFLRSVKEYPIWDDHDFGPDNSDKRFPFRELSREAFEHFWKISLSEELGVARAVKNGSIKLLLTDNRSFRSQPNITDGSLFGSKQLAWLKKELLTDKDLFVVIASGGQLLTRGPHHEDYGEYREEREKFFEILRHAKRPVIILSGDRHFADLIEIREGSSHLIEATASPLSGHSAPRQIVFPQVGRKHLYLGGPNYGVLSVKSTSETEWLVSISINDDSGAEVFRFDRRIPKQLS